MTIIFIKHTKLHKKPSIKINLHDVNVVGVLLYAYMFPTKVSDYICSLAIWLSYLNIFMPFTFIWMNVIHTLNVVQKWWHIIQIWALNWNPNITIILKSLGYNQSHLLVKIIILLWYGLLGLRKAMLFENGRLFC